MDVDRPNNSLIERSGLELEREKQADLWTGLGEGQKLGQSTQRDNEEGLGLDRAHGEMERKDWNRRGK